MITPTAQAESTKKVCLFASLSKTFIFPTYLALALLGTFRKPCARMQKFHDWAKS